MKTPIEYDKGNECFYDAGGMCVDPAEIVAVCNRHGFLVAALVMIRDASGSDSTSKSLAVVAIDRANVAHV